MDFYRLRKICDISYLKGRGGLVGWEQAVLLEQLHDEGSAMIQSLAQVRSHSYSCSGILVFVLFTDLTMYFHVEIRISIVNAIIMKREKRYARTFDQRLGTNMNFEVRSESVTRCQKSQNDTGISTIYRK